MALQAPNARSGLIISRFVRSRKTKTYPPTRERVLSGSHPVIVAGFNAIETSRRGEQIMGRAAHAARFHAERARCVRDSRKKRIVAGGWKSHATHASIPPQAELKCERARDIHAPARWNRRKQSLGVAKIHATGNNSIHRSTTASSSNACFGEAFLLLGHCLNVSS